MTDRTTDDLVAAWIAFVIDRHAKAFTRPELLKAIRALSARYVERRAELPRRSAIDSPGKRAAFAAFYAPLHLLTALGVARGLRADAHPAATILDLGCGTGVVSAAWALAQTHAGAITGVDTDAWVLDEARWNWRYLGLAGRTRRDDLVRAFASPHSRERRDPDVSLRIFGWAINEIDARSRVTLLDLLTKPESDRRGLLIIEPIAQGVSPWWPEWTDRIQAIGGRADLWRFETPLPDLLADLDEAAGFDREALTARSLWVPPAGVNADRRNL